MTIYKIETDEGEMFASADLSEASAPISTYFGSDPFGGDDDNMFGWNVTPYQTADAQHYEDRMAALVADYCDMGKVISVEVYEQPIRIQPMDLAEIDPALLADLDGDEGCELFEVDDPKQTISNQYYQLVYHAASTRAGIVFCGSGSSGLTFWTDASSPEDAMRRFLNDEMTC